MKKVHNRRSIFPVVKRIFQKILHPWLSQQALKRSESSQLIEYDGFVITIYPQVFHPFDTGSTRVLYNFLKNEGVEGEEVLELGAGSGLISLLLSRKGARVVASDINPHAIDGLIKNSIQNDIQIKSIVSDLFGNIGADRFDRIIINPPFYAKQPSTPWEHAFYAGAEFDYFKRLFANLGDHLKEGGHCLMILSRDIDQENILSLGVPFDFKYTLISSKRHWFEWYDIFKIEQM